MGASSLDGRLRGRRRPSRREQCLQLRAYGAEASPRFGVSRIPAHRLAERGGGGGRVAAHQADVAPEHVHCRRAREQLFIELQERERLIETAGPPEPERGEGRIVKQGRRLTTPMPGNPFRKSTGPGGRMFRHSSSLIGISLAALLSACGAPRFDPNDPVVMRRHHEVIRRAFDLLFAGFDEAVAATSTTLDPSREN